MSGDIHFRPRKGAAADTTVGSGSSGSGRPNIFARRTGDQQISRLREAEIDAAIDQIPALSSVVNQILTLSGSGNQHSSAGDMENLVRQDMVITGRLLKLVNSPFYALKHEVQSITQAVAIIGMGSLRSLVVAASMSGILMVDLRGYGYVEEGLWQNSIATAALSRMIILETIKDKDFAEECFIAALMRDIGMLVLAPFVQKADAKFTEDMANDAGGLVYLERATLGFDHVDIGARVAQHWDLPSDLQELMRHHHEDPKHIKDERIRHGTVAIQMAEGLAAIQKIGLTEDHPFAKSVDSKLLPLIGMSAEVFKDVLDHVQEVVEASQMDMG